MDRRKFIKNTLITAAGAGAVGKVGWAYLPNSTNDIGKSKLVISIMSWPSPLPSPTSLQKQAHTKFSRFCGKPDILHEIKDFYKSSKTGSE